MAESQKAKTNRKSSLLMEGVLLLLKLAIVALMAFLLLTYVFGLTRNHSLNMCPAFQDGDLVMYYRLDRNFGTGDVVVVRYREHAYLERVIASAGDTVDITQDGLVVNGSLVQEPYRQGQTTQFTEGVTFPLTVGSGELFVLSDNRGTGPDSRIFGCIRAEDVSGKVMGLFRRRNF